MRSVYDPEVIRRATIGNPSPVGSVSIFVDEATGSTVTIVVVHIDGTRTVIDENLVSVDDLTVN